MREVPEFVIGQQVTSTVEFRNATTGALADPTTTTWVLRVPSGDEISFTLSDPEITQTTTGTFVATYTVLEAGIHTSKWIGEGAVVAATEEWFRGQKSNLEVPLP